MINGQKAVTKTSSPSSSWKYWCTVQLIDNDYDIFKKTKQKEKPNTINRKLIIN